MSLETDPNQKYLEASTLRKVPYRSLPRNGQTAQRCQPVQHFAQTGRKKG
jgi:hypothetical protein